MKKIPKTDYDKGVFVIESPLYYLVYKMEKIRYKKDEKFVPCCAKCDARQYACDQIPCTNYKFLDMRPVLKEKIPK